MIKETVFYKTLGIQSVGVWLPFIVAPLMFLWMAFSYNSYFTKKDPKIEPKNE